MKTSKHNQKHNHSQKARQTQSPQRSKTFLSEQGTTFGNGAKTALPLTKLEIR